MHNILNKFSEEEIKLIEQHQKRSDALTEKHEKEILTSEQNNVSENDKSKMLMRHASELINLSHKFLNLWIDLIESQKNT